MDHIVFFRLSSFPASLERALRELSSLPFVLDVSVGRSFSKARAFGYTHGIVVRLRSKQFLPVYADHPQHLAVVALLKKSLDPSSNAPDGTPLPPPVLALDIAAQRVLGEATDNTMRSVSHVVPICLRPSDHPSCASCKQLDRDLAAGAAAMARGIPGVVDVTFGRSFTSSRARGFTHVLNCRFVDKAAGDAYQPHHLHAAFKKILKGNFSPASDCVGAVACLDWESLRG